MFSSAIEVSESLKFNPKNKKKKKNIYGYDDEIDLVPTLFFKQGLLLREIMMMVGNSSSSRLNQFGFYQASIHEKHKLACIVVVVSSDSAHHKFLTQIAQTHDDDDFPPYLLKHDYNSFIYNYQSRTANYGTLLAYGLCIPNGRLVFAAVFVNAGSKIFRSITPHDYLVEPNTITTISRTALISTYTTSVISSPVNDDWFEFEILTRLPVKSLLRFKTVCKRWGSLIQKDQNFIDSHLLNHSKTSLRRLFIVNPVPRKARRMKNKCDDDHDENFLTGSWPYEEIHITADLKLFEDDKGDTTVTNVVVVDTLREVDSTNYDIVSNPVNGLICLIESDFQYVVRICNISTGELSPWFESSLLSGEKEVNGIPCYRMHYSNPRPNYQLGFDPSTNEHKLVCVWEVSSEDRQSQYLICELLTVGRQGIHGDNRWRRIEEVPDVPPYYGLGEDSVYVNGVIYWSSFDLTVGAWESENRPIFVVAFDVGREKFRKITVSDFILDQPPRPYQGDDNPLDSPSYYYPVCDFVNLLEVGGCLALLVQMNNCLFKMYIYEDDDYKLEDEINKTPTCSGVGFSSKKNGRWTEAGSIALPFNLGKKGGVRFCKFVGSDDEIVLASSEGRNCDEEAGKKKCVSFYSCNWKKGSWREFEVSGIPSSIPHLCTGSYVTTFSESLLPINNDKALF